MNKKHKRDNSELGNSILGIESYLERKLNDYENISLVFNCVFDVCNVFS
ncbi:MAG: hypothetical protein B655_0482 [Methanobacterium sp. Maddingley MBC34]|nr:MAG: hypothetical protein B655_0482 [Methanobacterium sp. Maddingley MBC34]